MRSTQTRLAPFARTASCNPGGSALSQARGNSTKEWLSLALYAAAVPLAFVNRWISCALFVAVAILWLIPDRRIVAAMNQNSH